MAKIAVSFHSGYGHTPRMAEAVAEGAVAEGNISDGLGQSGRRRRHRHGLNHLHGQRVVAVLKVCRRVEQGLVWSGSPHLAPCPC